MKDFRRGRGAGMRLSTKGGEGRGFWSRLQGSVRLPPGRLVDLWVLSVYPLVDWSVSGVDSRDRSVYPRVDCPVSGVDSRGRYVHPLVD